MAVIVDPDNLTQSADVIYGTLPQVISLYPVGTQTANTGDANNMVTGVTVNANGTIQKATNTFHGMTTGDIVAILNTDDAGHYRVNAATNNTFIELRGLDSNTVPTFTANTSGTLRIFLDGSNGTGAGDADEGTGGNSLGTIRDGVTQQAVYSHAKEEWRTDGIGPQLSPTDDLIRHEFPFEAITSEQFEVGGGTSHDNWLNFSDYSRKKVRTGGWASKTRSQTGAQDLRRYTGIITLGSLDTDSEVYYQQTSATTNPTFFTFKGVVNEPILIYRDDNQDGTPDENYQTYLKLFVRKKARTYAQSEIADIGVTTIQTIVNRFPLTHAVDAAIANTDGQILGTTPFMEPTSVTLSGNTDGVKTASDTNFDSATAAYDTSGVLAGDTLYLTSADPETGHYTIGSVTDATNLDIAFDAEFVTPGWTDSNTAQTFEILSPVRRAQKTTLTSNGVVEDLVTNSSNGIINSNTSHGFLNDFINLPGAADGANGAAAAVNDFLYITGGAANTTHIGLYKISAVTNSSQLVVETADKPFPGSEDFDITYQVLTPGMRLEYKRVTLDANLASNVQFFAANSTIVITGDNWTAAATADGQNITVANTTSNDGTYTIDDGNSDATNLKVLETLVNEGPTTGDTAEWTTYEGFIRTINGINYGYYWRLWGNDSTLANCYQFVQHALRQSTDIDFGNATFRGDITDLLMSFATPTGTTFNMYIDDLDPNDQNNITQQDATGTARNFPFVAAGSLNFNTNLQNDDDSKYWLFFKDPLGDLVQNAYGTQDAVIVNDFSATPIQGNANVASVAFTFDYDNNTQGGRTANTDANVVLVCIGLSTAQYVLQEATITRATGQSISAVAALERNYSNP